MYGGAMSPTYVIHHIVIKIVRRTSGNLENLVNASSSDDGVGGGNGGNNTLNNTLSQLQGNSLDVEGVSTLASLVEDPHHVVWVVLVKLLALALIRPHHECDIFDAVLGLARGIGQCAHLKVKRISGEELEGALEARGDSGQDNTSLTLKGY
jgi:hypothetical protein